MDNYPPFRINYKMLTKLSNFDLNQSEVTLQLLVNPEYIPPLYIFLDEYYEYNENLCKYNFYTKTYCVYCQENTYYENISPLI